MRRKRGETEAGADAGVASGAARCGRCTAARHRVGVCRNTRVPMIERTCACPRCNVRDFDPAPYWSALARDAVATGLVDGASGESAGVTGRGGAGGGQEPLH